MLLNGMGIDRRDGNFKETSSRVTKMWTEWMKPHKIKIKVFETESDSAVTLLQHKTVSMCPHHMLPYDLIVSLGYIPKDYAVGLSKLARLIDMTCSSFILQENIGVFLTHIMEALLLPLGVACRVEGAHGCMRLRGVRTPGTVVTTTLRGVFFDDVRAREEFLREVTR